DASRRAVGVATGIAAAPSACHPEPMARKRRRARATTTCPQCGDEFPSGRPACPHCGSDADTGWSGDTSDFARDDDADYEEFVAGLQGRDPLDADPKWGRRKRVVMVTGLVIVALFVFFLLRYGSAF